MINLLAASKALQVFIPALILLVLAMLFAIALAYLGKKLAVSRDERIDQVRDCLSGTNRGACANNCPARIAADADTPAATVLQPLLSKERRNFPPAMQPQKKRKKKSRKFWDSPTPAKRRKSSFAATAVRTRKTNTITSDTAIAEVWNFLQAVANSAPGAVWERVPAWTRASITPLP